MGRNICLTIRHDFAAEFRFALSLESPRLDIRQFADQWQDSHPDCPFSLDELTAIGENSRAAEFDDGAVGDDLDGDGDVTIFDEAVPDDIIRRWEDSDDFGTPDTFEGDNEDDDNYVE